MIRLFAFFATFMAIQTIIGMPYRTQSLSEEIGTVQVLPNGESLQAPVVALGSEDWIEISFDKLDYEADNMYYKIVHCNAEWEPSQLSPMEYLDGFDQNMITNYQYSENTTVNYVHYILELPNEDVKWTISGNYAVLIAKDNDFEDGLVACACFSVVEPLTNISIDVTGKTMSELNGKYQQLSIDLNTDGVDTQNPMCDFILLVRQNDRYDNEALLLRPTFVNGNKLQYSNIKELEFEGGNQYRSIDFSSRYTYGAGIDHIEFVNDIYHVVLEINSSRANNKETYAYDANGGYVVNLQKSDFADTEADYMWVHFYFNAESPFLENMYLLGSLTSNQCDDKSKMIYNSEFNCYEKSIILKQGGYNYIFALKNLQNGSISLTETEGSFWQSRNKYDAYVYYRPFSARYDKLVGYSTTITE